MCPTHICFVAGMASFQANRCAYPCGSTIMVEERDDSAERERVPDRGKPATFGPRSNFLLSRPAMTSRVVKRSIVLAGHKTSVSLEDAFWNGLREIAGERRIALSNLVAAIDRDRQLGNLSSAIRLFVLGFYRNQLSVGDGECGGGKVVLITRNERGCDASPDETID